MGRNLGPKYHMKITGQKAWHCKFLETGSRTVLKLKISKLLQYMTPPPKRSLSEQTRSCSKPEVEILNNFWPFRFLKGVLIFIFIKNANLAVQIFGKVFTFSISSNHKSGRPDFWKGVHICVFDENRNVNTFSVQIWTGKVFTFWFSSKTKMWTPFQKSGRPDLRFEKKMKMWTRISVRPVQICDLK